MKIETLLGINGYSLIVCHCSGNSYQLSIIEQDRTIISFEGIYATLQIAIDRGKSVIQNLDYCRHDASKKKQEKDMMW